MKSTCWVITLVIATAPSLYGTWIILPPRRCASSSPARRPEVPLPADAKVKTCGRGRLRGGTFHRAGGGVGGDDEQGRRVADECDRREVAQRVVRHLAKER